MSKTILVISAHPDDAEEFFGGITKLLTDRNNRVIFLALTDGQLGCENLSPDEAIKVRHQEATTAAKLLGAEYHNMMIPDAQLSVNQHTITNAAQFITHFNPDIIITHPIVDYHPDHQASSEITRHAIWKSRLSDLSKSKEKPLIALYYVDPEGALAPSGQFAPVSDLIRLPESVFNLKLQAFESHQSQMGSPEENALSHSDRTRRIAIARGLLAGNQTLYAEGLTQDLRFGLDHANPIQQLLPEYHYRLAGS